MKEAKEVPIKLDIAKTTSRLFTPSLRLFKALPIERREKRHTKASELLTKVTISAGFVFSSDVLDNYSEGELVVLLDQIEQEIGLSPQAMNASFHKSWAKVRDTPMFQLVMEQAVHYLTTYGFEAMGIYNSESVYIPNEKLNIPELKDGIRLAVINGYTMAELKEKLLALLESGIALKEQTVTDCIEIALASGFTEKELALIRNKEVKLVLYEKLGIVPENPIEFLRFVVFKTTKKPLLIVNAATIKTIKESKEPIAYHFAKYDTEYGYKRLAEIFLRFKPLFLAFKTQTAVKPVINKIRKLAVKYHKPMHQDYLNSVTSKLANGESLPTRELMGELEHVSVFRKIRLAYALHYRLTGSKSILYKIRNGKSYATAFEFNDLDKVRNAENAYLTVLTSIVNDIKPNVKGKKFFIPSGVNYALPATQKQFTGNLPSGTYISIPKEIVAGIHWDNVGSNRIDLDLSVRSVKDGKIGWDARYRTESVLFSGDMTDASGGAAELFYIATKGDTMLMSVNYYNYSKEVPVPFKIMVGKSPRDTFHRNCMVDPNNVVCIAKTKITERQMILGLIVTTENECRFYFSESALGNTITEGGRPYTDQAREYLINFVTKSISLNTVLEMAGAEIVTEKIKDSIDLSPETLEVPTIINLLHSK